MLKDNTERDSTARIVALSAVVLALVGGPWLFNKANRDTESRIAVATNCSRFEADAHKLFNKRDTATLSGTFAPGDRVHLSIDFKGVGYSWKLTGVLGKANKADVTGSGVYTRVIESTTSRSTTVTADTTVKFGVDDDLAKPADADEVVNAATRSTVTRGRISGYARLDVDVDVTTAGDGAITINKSNVPLFASRKVASASCEASKEVPSRRGDASSS